VLDNSAVGDVPFEKVNGTHVLFGAGVEYMTSIGVGVDQCAGLNGVLEGVNFHSDKADLTTESTQILNEVAYTLSNCAELQIEISAHTDSVGAESYNQGLSERRARSVVEYLNTRGLSRSRFTATAFGESDPIDSNDTAEGRARNRRVELYAQ